MALLDIIETPDPRLRVKSTPVTEVNDRVRQLMADMLETMYAAPGIGLAAIQVGVPERILVIDLHDGAKLEGLSADDAEQRARNPRYFINPEIVWASETLVPYNEGCLSVPEQYAEVERPAQIRVRYLDYHGVLQEEEMSGLLATCLQHEMDHLEGVLFVDHLSRLKRDMLLRKLEKSRRQSA
jgi:peptide deformylase